MAKLRYATIGGSDALNPGTIIGRASRVRLDTAATIESISMYMGYYNDDFTVTAELWSDNDGLVGDLLYSGTPVSVVSGSPYYNTFPLAVSDIAAGYYWVAIYISDIDSGKYGSVKTAGNNTSSLSDMPQWGTVTPKVATRNATGWYFYASNQTYIFELAGTALTIAKPTTPAPANAEADVAIDLAAIEWVNGGNALSYDVYFGLDATPDSGELKGNQAGLTWPMPSTLFGASTYYWRIDAVHGYVTITGDVWNFSTASIEKPINPTPTDATGNIRANTSAVTWEDGGGEDTATETFDVYFGFSPEGLVLTQEDVPVATPTITSPYVIMDVLCDPLVFGGTNRLPIAGDVLTDGTTTYTVWKVQRGGLIDFSYTAKLYAYRVGAPVVNKDLTRTPSPDDNGETVRVHINGETGYLRPDKTLYWRVDAKAGASSVEGDVWSFGTWRGPTNPRSDDYDDYKDQQWQYNTGDGAYGWYDIDVAGGGRYKPHLIAVGHKVVYFT